MKNSKLRPISEITSDLEPLLQELGIAHGMQMHEIVGIVAGYVVAHMPESIEIYEEDNSKSVVYVGHWSGLK